MERINKQHLIELFETGKIPTGESFALLIDALCDQINHEPIIRNYNLYKKTSASNPNTVFNVPGIKTNNFSVSAFVNGWAWNPNNFNYTVDDELETFTVHRNSGTADDVILNICVFL